MNEEIRKLLERIIPKLIMNPKIMEGFDLTHSEVESIIENNKIPFEWLKEEVAWDNFFECCYDELGISYKDALQVKHYLVYKAKKELETLKKLFPVIE